MTNRSEPRTPTFFDWLKALMVPVAVAGLAAVIAISQTCFAETNEDRRLSTSSTIEAQRASTEQEIDTERFREATLQAYLGRMETLLLEFGLREARLGDGIRELARSYTLTTLAQLDGQRKGLVVRFLYESGLIGTGRYEDVDQGVVFVGQNFVVDLSRADLSDAELANADLTGADFSGGHSLVRDQEARHASDEGADLSGADLRGAKLIAVNLWRADLSGASLDDVDWRAAVCPDFTQVDSDDAGSTCEDHLSFR
jgi:hypothetical protein